jgi:hypothetical protein
VTEVVAKLQPNIMTWPPLLPCSNNNAVSACVCVGIVVSIKICLVIQLIEFDWNALRTALKPMLLIITIIIINMLMPAPMTV